MRSIYTVHILKRVMQPMLIKGGALAGLLWSLGALVWVARIFENLPSDLLGAARYMLHAFIQTEVLVQLVSVAIVMVACWMVYDMVRILSHHGRARMA